MISAESLAQSGETRVTIYGWRRLIDGEVTYPGAPAEGLLMNVRMASPA